jgi:hypothetical protein
MKRTIPIIIAFIVGMGLMLDNFITFAPLNTSAVSVRSWLVIIALFSIMVAALNLVMVHIPRIQHRKGTWVQSSVLITFMLLTIVTGIFMGTKNVMYSTFYNGILNPASTTVNALLAFFIASAAVRTFRARSLESSLLLLTAIILMLSNVTIGSAISKYIPAFGQWLTNVPNATAQRGLIITSSLAFVTINLRNILGLSTQWLGGKD